VSRKLTVSSKKEKKDDLLKKATAILMAIGPTKTTLNDIAEGVGMARTSLYYYFNGKDQIIKAIIRRELENSLHTMIAATDLHQTAEAKICALIEARQGFILQRAQRASNQMINDFKFMSGIFEPERESYLQAISHLIEKILCEGIRQKELRGIQDFTFTAHMLIASMVGCDHLRIFHTHSEQFQDAIREMVRFFFKGLKTEPPS